MDDIGYEHAVASQVSYLFENEGYETAEQFLIGEYPNYSIDQLLSDEHSITITKPNNEAIIAFRGTKPSRLRDDVLAQDVGGIATGLFESHIITSSGLTNMLPAGFDKISLAHEKTKLVKEKYDNITLTGHSAGAYQAMLMGKAHNLESYVFNTGAGISLASLPDLEDRDPKYQYNSNTYLVKGDPISFLATQFVPKEKIKFIPHTAPNKSLIDYYTTSPHSLENFLVKPTNIVEPKNITIPDKLVVGDRTYTDKVIIKKLCFEFPELCPKGE